MSPARAETVDRSPLDRGRQAVWANLLKTRRIVGQISGRARMRPDFLIAGAQRCGTTTLFHQLREHPNVVTSRLLKGAHWFDTGYDRSPEWYFGHFPLRSTKRAYEVRRKSPVVTGEASPYYLFHPLAAERIGRELPEASVIVLVRDPAIRAWSHYQHEVARGHETRSFEQALDEEAEMVAREEQRLQRNPYARSLEHQYHAYVARGRYAAQLERLWKHVPSEQVLVADMRRLTTDRAVLFEEVCHLLGIPVWVPPRTVRLNTRPYEQLAPATKRRLDEEFAEDRARLLALTGIGADWV